MKKTVVRLGVSALLSLALTGLNLLKYLLTGSIAGMVMYGGECVETVGFGLSQLTIYALSLASEGGGTSTHLSFAPGAFALMMVVFFLLLTAARFAYERSRQR